MMPAFSMRVPVRQFLRGGVPDCDDLDVKMQGLASKRMVAIKEDVVPFQFYDGEFLVFPFSGICGKIHPRYQIDVFGKKRPFGFDMEFGIDFSITLVDGLN